jgi:ABC-2 type transport system permease protein
MSRYLQTLRCSAWLAWQVESNWLSPWLFVLYAVVKPLTASLLLVCMYWAAQSQTGGLAPAGYLPFLYVGSACFMLVAGVTAGISSAVISDREQYGMLKYVRISPACLRSYLVGRGLSRGVQAGVGVLLALLIGLFCLPELRAELGGKGIAWGWLLLYLIEGLVLLIALGLVLAGTVLNMSRYGSFLNEVVVGALYLLSGVLFPLHVLPAWLQPVSMALPTTYWLEGMRRALLQPSELSAPLHTWGPEQLALALFVSTLTLSIFAHFFFHWCLRRAWRLGRFDQATGY